jgi:hypothetical protein
MHRSEEELLGRCVDCGAETQAGLERAFIFGAGGILCATCAARRGGVYDADLDEWTQEPDYGEFAREFDESRS